MFIAHVTSERVPREVGANVLTLLMLGTQFHTELKLTTKHQQDKWHADEDARPGEFVSRSGVIDM